MKYRYFTMSKSFLFCCRIPKLLCSIFLVLCFNLTMGQGLSALLVVGHQEHGTQKAMDEMDKIAGLFREKGVTVYRFYDNRAEWNEIVRVAKDCNFFVYSGHGSKMGENGNVGGICINSIVSTSELLRDLRLRNNAMVLLKSVCNGAGSSAGDDNDIGVYEAKNRVTHYANPFFRIGAAAYYANNYGDGVYDFLNDFFSGLTLKDAFVKSAEDWSQIEFEENFSKDVSKRISIASSSGGGISTRTSYVNGVKKVEQIRSPKSYDIAYVGSPEFSVRNMR